MALFDKKPTSEEQQWKAAFAVAERELRKEKKKIVKEVNEKKLHVIGEIIKVDPWMLKEIIISSTDGEVKKFSFIENN